MQGEDNHILEYLALIPARGGSKGLPGKNLRPLHGKPLITWSIEAARQCSGIGRLVVSTDDREVARISAAAGAEVPFLRPEQLARDDTPTEPVMLHALDALEAQGYRPDAVVLLQPTSPARRPGSIEAAIARFEAEQADSLVSVCENHYFFWQNMQSPHALYDFRHRPRRQDIAASDRWYRENGSVYITRTSLLLAEGNRLGGKIAMHVMSEAESWEVDSLTDLKIVEALLSEVVEGR